MAKGTTLIGKIMLQAALAVILIVSGLAVFLNGRNSEMIRVISGVFSNAALRDITAYIVAVLEIIAGVLLVLDFFHIKSLDRVDDLSLLVIIIVWCVYMVLADILPLFQSRFDFISWITGLAEHTLVLAAMIIVKAKI